MSSTQTGLPFATGSHTSWLGAVDAEGRAPNQTLLLLEIYAKRGPLSDWQVHKLTGWERTTVNARRRPLVVRGIVVAVDTVKNDETGVSNTRWCISVRRDSAF